jgi:hypothetical protein
MLKSNYKKIILVLLVVLLFYGVFFHGQTENSHNAPAILKTSNLHGSKQRIDIPTEIKNEKSKLSIGASEVASSSKKINDASELCEDLLSNSNDRVSYEQLMRQIQQSLKRADPDVTLILQRWANDSDPRRRAAALSLLATKQYEDFRQNFLNTHSNCESSRECELQMLMLSNNAVRSELASIAKMAIYSSDPIVYGMAFNACNAWSDMTIDFCAQISAAQWARLDPDNGIAWMRTLEQLGAASGKNQSAIENALYRISQVNRFDAHFDIMSNLPEDELTRYDYVTRTSIENLVTLYWANSPLPAYSPIVNACKGVVLNDANRRHMCEQIAGKLQRENSFLIDHGIARRIGENLGWDKSKTQAMFDEFDAIRGMMIDRDRRSKSALASHQGIRRACTTELNWFGLIRTQMKVGEFKSLRAELAKYDVPRETLIRLVREPLKK